MTFVICRHTKMDGARCGSPAMRGQHYCYFHAPSHRTIPALNLWPEEESRPVVSAKTRRGSAGEPASSPRQIADERAALHNGLLRVVRALMEDRVNVRQGWLLLKPLCEASADWRRRAATGSSAVTSNQLRSSITDDCGVTTGESRGG